MIYEFKSRATGTVVMTQAVAERILQIIGKPAQVKGVILPEQMPTALEALKLAIDQDRTLPTSPAAHRSAPSDPDAEMIEPDIPLASRALPFQEMLREAYAAHKEITWGV